MKVLPTDDRILVKPIEETRSKGGIVLPDAAQKKPERGVVVAVGPGMQAMEGNLAYLWTFDDTVTPWALKAPRVAVSLRVGQTVLFGRYSGAEVDVDGERLLLMQEGDVLAVIEE